MSTHKNIISEKKYTYGDRVVSAFVPSEFAGVWKKKEIVSLLSAYDITGDPYTAANISGFDRRELVKILTIDSDKLVGTPRYLSVSEKKIIDSHIKNNGTLNTLCKKIGSKPTVLLRYILSHTKLHVSRDQIENTEDFGGVYSTLMRIMNNAYGANVQYKTYNKYLLSQWNKDTNLESKENMNYGTVIK